jgi:heme A synthase
MGDLSGIYFLGAAAVWLVLQVAAVWLLDGRWRTAAWLPVFAMGAAIAVAVLGVMAGSNLAPIWVVFALPLCFVWITALWVIRGLAWLVSRSR